MQKKLYLCAKFCNNMQKSLVFLFALCSMLCAHAAVQITEANGWLESAHVKWTPQTNTYYHVYVRPEGGSYVVLDRELLRDYGSFCRADAIGLKAGKYQFKVVPVINDAEKTSDATETAVITVKAHDRNGFAHFNYSDGVGAYRNDGTLKDGAKVLYIHKDNAATVEMDVKVDKKGTLRHCTGIQHIICAYEKGCADQPLAIRILGTIEANQVDSFGSKEEGLQIKCKEDIPMDITLEGVGNDAVIRGFGILARQAQSLELRNFAIMTAFDDCISLDTKNYHVWIHHIDGFYSKPGSASDQKKGDGTIDVKGNSKYVTISYNHFWDTGKSSMCGMKQDTESNYITYHHNWFDHSDSRHPRIRRMSVHIYNNYFDGIAKYAVGMTNGGSAFVENNYFRGCQKPMLISMQGTDTKNGTDEKDAPTFSKEDGGIIKAYNNVFVGSKTLVYYSSTNTVHFDAYLAQSRDEKVPATVICKQGETSYDNFDTDASLMPAITPDDPNNVPTIVKSEFGAGRMYHGDFNYSLEGQSDSNSELNQQLANLITEYKSSFVSILGEESTPTENITIMETDKDLSFDGHSIHNPQAKLVRVYTLSGACLGSTVSTEFSVDHLPVGVYIAVTKNGTLRFAK